MQPQIELHDYTDRSIVVRTNPQDFFKPYSEYLTQYSGKFIPGLDYPNKGGQTKVPGWIFPKKNEAQVRQALSQILSGQVAQAPPSYHQPQSRSIPPTSLLTSVVPMQQPQSRATPPASLLTSVVSIQQQQQPALPTVSAPSAPNILSLVPGLPGAAPTGHQQIVCTVLRPSEGAALQLVVAGQRIPLMVETTQQENGIVNGAIVKLPDGQRTMIRLNLTGMPRWEVPGFTQEHSITV